MDRDKLQTFVMNAESGLASIRSSLLIVAQTGDASDLTIPRRDLARLGEDASAAGLIEITALVEQAIAGLNAGAANISKSTLAYAVLDIVTKIEAAIWRIPLNSAPFLDDISGFVDASFNEIVPVVEQEDWTAQEFEIDEETLEIFRSEADELLVSITHSIEILARSPNDQNALWDIRRSSHTFKGAAGIVGLNDASAIAHRMEDLLDTIVESRLAADPSMVAFLSASAERLSDIVASKETALADLDELYLAALASVPSGSNDQVQLVSAKPRPEDTSKFDPYRPTTTPIVRVSLDRLDELVKVSRSLLINRSALVERFTELSLDPAVDSATLAKLESIFQAQQTLTDEMHSKLLRIRMVRFSTLETRLNRAVHVTSLDENKKTRVEIENGDVEIDTQIIDALIEPLLHLLKNAVVHGIEAPETRRLICKPETGTIRICIEADDEAVVLSVSDDGAGIAISKLKEKAIANGSIDAALADVLTDREALKLIFDRGLTTAEKIDLNSGRGVGMSIVKESVESRGGTVHVESESRRGTTFTILLPLAVARPDPVPAALPESPVTETLPPLVLVVDDSASIRRQATKIIEKAGLRVITADSGADALELLLNGTFEPDLIFSDVEMPQIDGWNFLEYVKTDENFGHIPMVMVTSLDRDDHRARAFELGAADYVTKPFSEADLTRILEKIGLDVLA
jgi:CheY-like chemotaxis protein